MLVGGATARSLQHTILNDCIGHEAALDFSILRVSFGSFSAPEIIDLSVRYLQRRRS